MERESPAEARLVSEARRRGGTPQGIPATAASNSTRRRGSFQGNPQVGCSKPRRGFRCCLPPHALEVICSLLSTREDHLDGGSLSLWPERRPVLIFQNKGASRTHGKHIEDAFVSLACNRAGLATLSIDETNDRSAWGPCRAWRPSFARWSLGSLFSLSGGLHFSAGSERDH